MDYKKIYCDKWKAAYPSNTVVDKDNIVELHWKQVPLGWMSCGPNGVVFTKLYSFYNDQEGLNKISAFPAAEKEFNALLKNVATLESVCQMWEEVTPHELEIDMFHAGRQYGCIRFNHGEVLYEGLTGDGWKTSKDPQVLIKYRSYIVGKTRDVAMMDDMMLIDNLGRMIKR